MKLKSRGMVDKIEKAKENETNIELKESILIEKAKRVYGIDFQDKTKLLQEAQQEKFKEE